MIAALAAALWGRPVLFPTEARSTPSDMVRKQVDPPTEEAEDLILCSGLPVKYFQVIRFSDVPPGNKRYLICSRKIEEMTLLRLNRAIKDYLLGSMAPNPAGMAATP
jgi:hypothetical protein